MREEENILDNDGLYQEPEIKKLELPTQDLEINDSKEVEWTSLRGLWYYRSRAMNAHKRTMFSNGEFVELQPTLKRSYYVMNSLMVVMFAFLSIDNPTNLYFLAFMLVTIVLEHYLNPISFFDKFEGFFWKRAKIPVHHLYRPKERFPIKLTDIIAVQLLKRRKLGGNYAYEINLVLINKERINILAHEDETSLANEAEFLAKFLDVQLLSGEERRK